MPATEPQPSSPPNAALRPVELAGIGRLFGPVRALAGVTLRLEAGETCLLLGPNGAGKSTLLRILAGLLRPTAGRIRYGGRTAAEAGAALRARLGYLAHRTQLHADLTGRETLELTAAFHGVESAATRRWAERTGVPGFEDRPVRTYSRGQAQRLALARTFLSEPDVVLLDEPTTGLDRDAVGMLRGILADQAARGATLVIATHDAGLFAGLARRTVRIEAGRVVTDGPTETR